MPDEIINKPSKSCSHLYQTRFHHFLFEVDAMELRPIGKLYQSLQVFPVNVLTIGSLDGLEDAIEGLYFFLASQNFEQKWRGTFTIEKRYDLVDDV